MLSKMSDEEIKAWMKRLGRNRTTQKLIIRDLLHHANTDNMSLEDRQVCARALEIK